MYYYCGGGQQRNGKSGDKQIQSTSSNTKETINQTAHLEMQLMQMKGQKEKSRGWLGRIRDRVWSWRRVDLGTNFVMLFGTNLLHVIIWPDPAGLRALK